MPVLERDGVGIHYDVFGSGPRTVLLSHGWAASSRMFAANAEALAAVHTVVIWDLRGHGRSDYPSDPAAYTTPLAVGDMIGLLDVVGAERAIVAGHSLGGYLSLELVLTHPDRVEGLVLVDTGPGYRNAEARAGWNAMAERFAARLDARGLDGLPGGQEQRRDEHRDAAGLAAAARGILTQHDARVIEGLPAIAVPTLVIVGSADEPFLAGSHYMAAKIPGATYVEIEGAGHAPNLTHAAQFDRAVLDFGQAMTSEP
jgi:pimeloyl-ACP methyl ester carboxylesterase